MVSATKSHGNVWECHSTWRVVTLLICYDTVVHVTN